MEEIEMEEHVFDFLRLLATTPITKKDALDIITEDELNELDQKMFVILTDKTILLPSPLLPAPKIDENESVRTYKRHVISEVGGFQIPLDLIQNEYEKKHIFSNLINQTVIIINALRLEQSIPQDEKKRRMEIIHDAYNNFFGDTLNAGQRDFLCVLLECNHKNIGA